MVTPDSLPARPLDTEETDELAERDDVDSVIPYVADGCRCGTDTVEHFFCKIDGEYVGFDFDAEAGWLIRSRAPTWVEAKTAYAENRAAGTAE